MTMEFDSKTLAIAKELNRSDSGGIGTYEWNHYENGDRAPDTVRHVNRYIDQAKGIANFQRLSNIQASVEHISHDGVLLAIIVRASFSNPGVSFFTTPELSQQLGYMQHPAGKKIAPHVHNKVERTVAYTQETLFIRRGVLQVDFYSQTQNYLYSRTLASGDVVLLIKGGHGFSVIEDVEMFEVKQGPYAGDQDKTLFSAK